MFLELEIQAEMKKYWRMLKQKFPSITLDEPKVHLVDLGRTGGKAWPGKNMIELNKHFLQTERDKVIGKTLPHELAHLVVFHLFPYAKQAHGPEFKRVLDSIHVDNSTYHTMKVADIKDESLKIRDKVRYLYRCGCPGMQHKLTAQQHKKLQSGRVGMTCRRCRQNIRFITEGINVITL
jgi:SprT protein